MSIIDFISVVLLGYLNEARKQEPGSVLIMLLLVGCSVVFLWRSVAILCRLVFDVRRRYTTVVQSTTAVVETALSHTAMVASSAVNSANFLGSVDAKVEVISANIAEIKQSVSGVCDTVHGVVLPKFTYILGITQVALVCATIFPIAKLVHAEFVRHRKDVSILRDSAPKSSGVVEVIKAAYQGGPSSEDVTRLSRMVNYFVCICLTPVFLSKSGVALAKMKHAYSITTYFHNWFQGILTFLPHLSSSYDHVKDLADRLFPEAKYLDKSESKDAESVYWPQPMAETLVDECGEPLDITKIEPTDTFYVLGSTDQYEFIHKDMQRHPDRIAELSKLSETTEISDFFVGDVPYYRFYVHKKQETWRTHVRDLHTQLVKILPDKQYLGLIVLLGVLVFSLIYFFDDIKSKIVTKRDSVPQYVEATPWYCKWLKYLLSHRDAKKRWYYDDNGDLVVEGSKNFDAEKWSRINAKYRLRYDIENGKLDYKAFMKGKPDPEQAYQDLLDKYFDNNMSKLEKLDQEYADQETNVVGFEMAKIDDDHEKAGYGNPLSQGDFEYSQSEKIANAVQKELNEGGNKYRDAVAAPPGFTHQDHIILSQAAINKSTCESINSISGILGELQKQLFDMREVMGVLVSNTSPVTSGLKQIDQKLERESASLKNAVEKFAAKKYAQGDVHQPRMCPGSLVSESKCERKLVCETNPNTGRVYAQCARCHWQDNKAKEHFAPASGKKLYLPPCIVENCNRKCGNFHRKKKVSFSEKRDAALPGSHQIDDTPSQSIGNVCAMVGVVESEHVNFTAAGGRVFFVKHFITDSTSHLKFEYGTSNYVINWEGLKTKGLLQHEFDLYSLPFNSLRLAFPGLQSLKLKRAVPKMDVHLFVRKRGSQKCVFAKGTIGNVVKLANEDEDTWKISFYMEHTATSLEGDCTGPLIDDATHACIGFNIGLEAKGFNKFIPINSCTQIDANF